MSDTMQHTNGTQPEAAERLTGRKLANAMNLLLSDLADAIDARYPHKGKSPEGVEDSAEYVNNYAAHGAAYKLIEALLLGQPEHHDHRMEMHRYALDAWTLYGGRTDQDDVIRKCIGRAADDYKPDTPEQKQRGNKVAAAEAPKPLAAKKQEGKP